jgi:hypothetical protein
MSIVQPVIEAKDAELARERKRIAAIHGWQRSNLHRNGDPPEDKIAEYAEISRLQEMISTLIEEVTGGHRAQETELRRKFTP